MRVAIVGGGLAGLFTATRLMAKGVDDLVVLEVAEGPGGVATTMERQGFLLETGVGSMALPNPHLNRVLEGLDDALMPAADSATIRHVFTGDRLVSFRGAAGAIRAPLISVPGRLRAAGEVLVREQTIPREESLDQFLRRRLGTEAGSMAGWLVASGVFAGDSRALSAASAFPSLVGAVGTHGSLTRAAIRGTRKRRGMPRPRVHIPARSMADIADRLTSSLGDRFRAGHRVIRARPSGSGWSLEGDLSLDTDELVLACDPSAAAEIIGGPLAETLGAGHAAPVAVVWLGGESEAMPVPEGYGILAAEDAGLVTRGMLLESSYAPHRAPDGNVLVKAIVGGAGRPFLPDLDDDALIDLVVAEGSRMVGHELVPEMTAVVRHWPGIPQYDMGHQGWLDSIDASLPPNLHLTGWGYRGVGVSHLAADAERVAGAIVG